MLKKVFIMLLVISLIFCLISCNLNLGTQESDSSDTESDSTDTESDAGKTMPEWLKGKWINKLYTSYQINFTDSELDVTVPGINSPIKIPYNKPGIITEVENDKFTLRINKDLLSTIEIAVLEQFNLSYIWIFEKEGENLKVNMGDTIYTYISDSTDTESDAGKTMPEWLKGKWINKLYTSYQINFTDSELDVTVPGINSPIRISYNKPGIITEVEKDKFTLRINKDLISTIEIAVLEQFNLSYIWIFEKEGENLKVNMGDAIYTYIRDNTESDAGKTMPEWLKGKWINKLYTSYQVNFTDSELDVTAPGINVPIRITYNKPGIITEVEKDKFTLRINKDLISTIEIAVLEQFNLSYIWIFEKEGENLKVNMGDAIYTYIRDNRDI